VKGQEALVKEQGVSFAVVVVKRSTLQGPKHRKDESVRALSSHFGVPAVLMAQDSHGRATYYGRPDIMRFLSHLYVEQLPWRDFWIN
jgi:hypothetical protein